MTGPDMKDVELAGLAQRLHKRLIVAENDCWLWTGYRNKKGYGQIWHNSARRVIFTHRASVMLSGRTIPQGMQVDHLCRNPGCCNPCHLEVVTPSVNTSRGNSGKLAKDRAKKQTHCAQGHPRTSANVYVRRDGKTQCAACAVERKRVARLDRIAQGLTLAGGQRKRRYSPRPHPRSLT